MTMTTAETSDVLRLDHPDLHDRVASLLARYSLTLRPVPARERIPGSHWGDEEAGLLGHDVLARSDTPVHSVLHEACHAICMAPERRAVLHTDAGGDDLEECAVCYLSILLADEIEGFGSSRMLGNMDAWGYSFRFGGARQWFHGDAQDARRWLLDHGLIDEGGRPTRRLRG